MQALAQLCIRRPVFATMLIMALVVLGLDGYRKLGVDFFPKVEFPIVSISTTLRGAAPEEVETQVTKRIEEAVNTVAGIDDLFSTSAEGFSRVSIQFVLSKDPEVAAQEVRDKVSAILGQLPRDADPPVIEKISTDASPALSVVVSAERDLREITKLADDRIKKNIESLPGVGQVRFVGDRKRQIQVLLDGEKLYSYNLNVEQVRASLAAQNVEIPGGRVDQGQRELSLRTLGRVERPKDFERIIVGSAGAAPIRVSDIGVVIDGVEEPRSLARLDGKPAVVLEVRKQAGTNTLTVIDTIKERIRELQTTLPADFQIAYANDQSHFIRASFKAVQEHLILGGVLAGLVVMLFMRSWRSTLIAAVAIPTSVIPTYGLIQWMGFTLNQITMLALTLMVGIVIDDAIVVLENIFRFQEEKNLSPMQAAVQGTRDIGLAVLATTLSLAIVFIPVALMEGIVGRFMSSFGYTAAFAVMVSLLVSFTLTPMLCSRFLKTDGSGKGQGTKDTILFRALAVPYRGLLRWSMSHRWVIVLLAAATLGSSVPLFLKVGKDFLPTDDQSEFEVTVRMPAGSSLDGTARAMEEIEEELRRLPGVRNLLTTIGADVRRQVDRGSILVELVPIEARRETQRQIMDMARERTRRFHDMIIGVQLPSLIQGAGPNQDVQYVLRGPDLKRLEEYTGRLKEVLRQTPGVTDVDSTFESGKPELRVLINRDKAADLNVSVNSIASALRTLVGGDDQVTTYREGDDRYDVQLRVKKEFRDSPNALNRLFVPSLTLGNVPVANVAALQEATGPIQIDRQNRQRQIMISANLVGGQSLSNVLAVLDQASRDLDMPMDYLFGPVGRSRELGRAAAAYVVAFLLSLLFMYMILAAQFESFIDPVTILISLPLSVPFALVSLLVMGENFSVIYSSVGILVLFGIVKKNSILQVDHIKSLRAQGMPRQDAVLKGCEDRLRPILMTTAALVAGMLPLALGTGAGSGTRRTVAIVVIGGQTLCLLLTLVVTPVAYSLFDDLAHLRIWSRVRAAAPRGAYTSMLLAGLLLAGSFLPAQAQPGLTNETMPPPRVGVGVVQRKLGLREAVEMALRNNLDVEIQRTETAAAAQGVQAARGAFDLHFRWLPGYNLNNLPAANVLQGNGLLTERNIAQNFHLRRPGMRFGTLLHLDFENGRQTTNNPFTGFNPFVTSRLTVGFTQPLLRNRRTDAPRTELRIRQKSVGIADAQLELRVIAVTTAVERAYWDLLAVRKDVEVEADGVRWGQEQLARNRRMIESGTLPPVELAASVAELERRRDNWYQALGSVTVAENELKSLLAPNRESALWGEEIIPVDERPVEPVPSDDLGQVVAGALKQRAELRLLALRSDTTRIQREFAQDQIRPQLNLVAAYSNAGLAGTVNASENPFSSSQVALFQRLNQLSSLAGLGPIAPPSFGSLPGFLVGGYGTALSNLFGGRYQSFQAGLAMDWTLRNRAAQANLAQVQISERRLELERVRMEQAIEAQVRNALQAIQTAEQRMAAAQASVRAAQEKLDSEIRLFQTGESTNFLVLTRQNEFLDSRRRALFAQLAYNRAVAQLSEATGAKLGAYNITIQ